MLLTIGLVIPIKKGTVNCVKGAKLELMKLWFSRMAMLCCRDSCPSGVSYLSILISYWYFEPAPLLWIFDWLVFGILNWNVDPLNIVKPRYVPALTIHISTQMHHNLLCTLSVISTRFIIGPSYLQTLPHGPSYLQTLPYSPSYLQTLPHAYTPCGVRGVAEG